MDAPQHVLPALMSASPSEIAIIAVDPKRPPRNKVVYPAAVHDWVLAKCPKLDEPERVLPLKDDCASNATSEEWSNRHDMAGSFGVEYYMAMRMSDAELHGVLQQVQQGLERKRNEVGYKISSELMEISEIARYLLENKVWSREFPKIEKLGALGLKQYLALHYDDETYWSAVKVAHERLQALTGTWVTGIPKADCRAFKRPMPGTQKDEIDRINACAMLMDEAKKIGGHTFDKAVSAMALAEIESDSQQKKALLRMDDLVLRSPTCPNISSRESIYDLVDKTPPPMPTIAVIIARCSE